MRTTRLTFGTGTKAHPDPVLKALKTQPPASTAAPSNTQRVGLDVTNATRSTWPRWSGAGSDDGRKGLALNALSVSHCEVCTFRMPRFIVQRESCWRARRANVAGPQRDCRQRSTRTRHERADAGIRLRGCGTRSAPRTIAVSAPGAMSGRIGRCAAPRLGSGAVSPARRSVPYASAR